MTYNTDAFQVVRDFEQAVADYTGAPYVVTVNSCTAALFLTMLAARKGGYVGVQMPARTYPSVPMAAVQAGLKVRLVDEEWSGVYRITATNIWDCAKRFTSGMYHRGTIMCVSFHAAKMLKVGQGGAILHDDLVADEWYRRMRFDGRTEGVPTAEDEYPEPGYHCYLSPDAAARGLWLMQSYPKDMPDQEMHPYPDMRKWVKIWQNSSST